MRTARALATGLAAALLLLAALTATAGDARAQACCSGGGALAPWRLEHHEHGLVGLRARVTPTLGDFDADGEYRAVPKGVRELEAEALVFGSVRVAPRVQVGVQAPFVLTNRASGGVDAASGGLGDMSVGVRWDPLWAGELGGLPGLALELGVVAPTGTAPEEATAPLGVDATGIGAWQVGLDGSVEHVFGADRQWLASLRGGFRWRAPREVHGRTIERAVEGRASLGGAYVFDSGLALAASLDAAWEGGGDAGASAAQHLVGLGLNLGAPLGESWRCLASVSSTLPIDGLAANRPWGVALAMTLLYAGW